MTALAVREAPIVLRLDQVAERLQVSRATVDRIVASGELRVTRVGSGRGHPRVHPRDLDAYLAGRAGRRRR